MKIVILDGYVENPGDLSGENCKTKRCTILDRTAYYESLIIAEHIVNAEIVVTNKTPISKATMDACLNMKLIAF